MPNVHILKPEIISKIAAGEVIERPASVIKELIENSLDAQATEIDIRIEGAGKTLIEVRDNGLGIAQEDLETIFHRHATSKIASLQDLYAIQSLGFRGEALYSIAAISHISLHSKPDRQDTPMGVHLRGGDLTHIRPCSFNGRGAQIAIKELFFNTPARKKFLKSDTAETHQILSTVLPYTLFHHDVRFRLASEKKDLLAAAPVPNRVQRFADIFNLEERHLQFVQHDFPDRGLEVQLILGDINLQRTRRDMQFIFVNGRPVQNKAVAFHMNQVYRLILPPDLAPCFAVYLTVPAETVDVNIHPTKREVKIKNEQDICAALRSLTEQALMAGGQIKEAGVASVRITRAGTVDSALLYSHPSETAFKDTRPSATTEVPAGSGDYAYPRGATGRKEQQEFFIPDNAFIGKNKESLHERLREARYVGLAMNKFLLFEAGRSILVIDQHAAAERITYEQLIRQMDKGTVEVQHLLTPVLIKMTPQEIFVWEEAENKFEQLGLSVTRWDDETLAVHTHPSFLRDIASAVPYLLSGEDIAACDHDALARRACRSSVMAGDKLSAPEAEQVRTRLIGCLDPFTCPHGRPTVIELSEDYLDKQFLRC